MKNLKLWISESPWSGYTGQSSIPLPFELMKKLHLLAFPQLEFFPFLPVTKEIKILSNSFFVSLIRQFVSSMRILLASDKKVTEQTSYKFQQLYRMWEGWGWHMIEDSKQVHCSKQEHCRRCGCGVELHRMSKDIQRVNMSSQALVSLSWVRAQTSRPACEQRFQGTFWKLHKRLHQERASGKKKAHYLIEEIATPYRIYS